MTHRDRDLQVQRPRQTKGKTSLRNEKNCDKEAFLVTSNKHWISGEQIFLLRLHLLLCLHHLSPLIQTPFVLAHVPQAFKEKRWEKEESSFWPPVSSWQPCYPPPLHPAAPLHSVAEPQSVAPLLRSALVESAAFMQFSVLTSNPQMTVTRPKQCHCLLCSHFWFP